jgi:hypothetical protein
MDPNIIQQMLHTSTKHDPDIIAIEQSFTKLRQDAEAKGLRVAEILIPPCNVIVTQFKVYGLLLKISKLPIVNGLTDTEIVSAITKAVALTGLVNSIINIVNVKLIENAKDLKKHGLNFKDIDDELYYSLEREPISGPDYVYKVETMSNSGELLTTKVPFSQIIKQLLVDPLIPLDSLEMSLNEVTSTFAEWMTNFRTAMIQTW